MTRSVDERFQDIVSAIERSLSYREHLDDEDPRVSAMAYDATLRDLAVIGEAVRALPETTKDSIPDVPWASIAGLRNIVVHEYFRIQPDLSLDILDHELAPLADRLRSLPL